MYSGKHCAPRRKVLGAVALLLALGLPMGSATAEGNYPSKPIRLIVPYPPGGGTDIVARLLAQKLSQSMGQQVIVDNKGGASTIIGTDQVAKAAPDGYTIGLITDSHAINASFFPKLPYDSANGFAPISQLVSVPLVMVATPSANIRSLGDCIALAKAKPGVLNYASIGNGTPHQLAMEWIKSLARIDVNHVPYKGVAPALADLMAGQVQLMFTGTSTAAPYVKQGRVVPLAVTSAKRQASFPTVPTVAEAGLPKFEFMSWYGIVAPAGTPREAVQRLAREIKVVLSEPEIKERLEALGVVASPSSPEEFRSFLRKETEKMAKLVNMTGVKPD
nr:tripartite tricarboxylate transporter substrate binding protein [uncultured Cupriavidus sp.]